MTHPDFRPVDKYVVLSFLLLAAGFLITAWIASFFPDLHFQRTYAKRSEIPQYELFNPIRANEKKIILLGNCFTFYNAVTNNENGDYILHGTAYYGQVLNFLVKNEYSGNATFFDFGSSGTGCTDHLWFFSRLLHATNITTLIYTNGPGGYYHFYVERPYFTLETLSALEKLRRAYPRAAADIDRYSQALKASEAYRIGVDRYGTNWRDRIDPRTMLLPDKPEETPVRAGWDGFARMAGVRDLIVHYGSRIVDASNKTWYDETRAQLEKLRASYPDNKRLVVRPQTQAGDFSGDNFDLNVLFLRIVASICQEESIRFVYYLPPMLGKKKDFVVFETAYKSRLEAILKPYGATIIDQTMAHTLSPFDFCWTEEKRPGSQGEKLYRYRRGHVVNIIGNIKRGRMLLDALALDGLTRRPGAEAWLQEKELPQPDPTDYDSESDFAPKALPLLDHDPIS